MLVFSEGVPRSGKSYDAVKNHILPALKKRRHVFARLNGLNAERIAAHLELELEVVQAHLHLVDTKDVRETFVATQDGSGKWTIDAKFKNALVVIDEVHEFYIGGTREPLPPEIEQFFALHGHYGMDVLTMTQFYKRVHTAIRYRIERKNVFQKLSALGKLGESKYTEASFQTVAPDKYEKVNTRTHSYDKLIWPLYHGIVDGGESGVEQTVYDGGRSSVWKAMALRAAIILPLGGFAVWYLLDFFSGGGAALVEGAQPSNASAPMQAGVYQPDAMPGDQVQPVQKPKSAMDLELADKLAKKKKLEAMTPGQRYIWQLSEGARIRLAAQIGTGEGARGLLEWVNASQTITERLTIKQVRDLGIRVDLHDYGALLTAAGEVVIATAWPLNVPIRDERNELYRTDARAADGAGPSGSEALAAAATTGSATPAGLIPYRGKLPGRGFTGPGE